MKKYKKLVLILILTLVFIYLIFNDNHRKNGKNLKLNTNDSNYSEDGNKIQTSFLFNHTFNTSLNEFILHSKCYCHKEYIHVKLENDYYQIFVKNFDETYFYSYNISKKHFESLSLTCNLYQALRHGPNQKVISYSLQRSNANAKQFLDRLAETLHFVKSNYKNWRIRIYHDNSIEQTTICEKQCLKGLNNKLFDNVDFCDITKIPIGIVKTYNVDYMLPSTWRWFPMGDEFVNRFVSRDIESCLLFREVEAVKEWVNSKSLFHFMRDHPNHDKEILGGLWGLYIKKDRRLARSLINLITDKRIAYYYETYAKPDEELLKQYVWQIAKNKNSILSHDSYYCEKYDSISFPTQRVSNCYVGSIECCSEINKDERTLLPKCPEACRPVSYQNDWLYC